MERIMGVEPTTSAWEANVLPINYIRIMVLYHFTKLLSSTFLIFQKNFKVNYVLTEILEILK